MMQIDRLFAMGSVFFLVGNEKWITVVDNVMQLWYSMIHDYTWVVLLQQILAFIDIKCKLAIIHMHCMCWTLDWYMPRKQLEFTRLGLLRYVPQLLRPLDWKICNKRTSWIKWGQLRSVCLSYLSFSHFFASNSSCFFPTTICFESQQLKGHRPR